jgi:hypothetical protein
MYILVFTRKKHLNAVIVSLISIILFAAVILLIRLITPETEITLEQRMSFLFSTSTRISSIYMASPNPPAAEAGILIGKRWKTEKIQQLEMSEITFQYPEALRMAEIKNLGQEIYIHLNYQHTNNKVFGFFQVWKLNQSLKKFLDNSKKYSSMSFIDFCESPIKIQDMNGFLWEYVFMTKTEDIVGMEAFLEKSDEMYRFSMFVPRADYKASYKRIFLRMVKSLRVRGTGVKPNISYVGLD